MYDPEMLIFLGSVTSAVAAGGASYGVMRTRTKTTETNVIKLDKELKEHAAEDIAHHLDTVQRLARIETGIQDIKSKLNAT